MDVQVLTVTGRPKVSQLIRGSISSARHNFIWPEDGDQGMSQAFLRVAGSLVQALDQPVGQPPDGWSRARARNPKITLRVWMRDKARLTTCNSLVGMTFDTHRLPMQCTPVETCRARLDMALHHAVPGHSPVRK